MDDEKPSTSPGAPMTRIMHVSGTDYAPRGKRFGLTDAGTIEADRPLAGSVVRNASAACADPRLPSIQPSELADLRMTISIISPIERIFPQTREELGEMLEVGRHGVLVTSAAGRAAQLPAMWARLPTHQEFVDAVAQKAQVAGADQVGHAAWYRFETIDY